MDDQQKKNLLAHADFLDKVVNVRFANGIEMAVYYSTNTLEEFEEDEYMDSRRFVMNGSVGDPDDVGNDGPPLKDALPEEGPCGFCACAIGWAAKSDLPKPNIGEEWDDYSDRIFGINNWDRSQGAYCFSAVLNIRDASEIANRIRQVVAAYPEHLIVLPDDITDGEEINHPEGAIYAE